FRVIRYPELALSDRFLRGEAGVWDARPPRELFVMGANEWRGEHEWPLARTELTPWYLRRGGGLAVVEPRADEPGDRFAYDPADAVPPIVGVTSELAMTEGAAPPVLRG